MTSALNEPSGCHPESNTPTGGEVKLTKHQQQLGARILAMPSDKNGWRDRPDDLTLGEARTLNRWYRLHWVDLEEDGSIRIQPAGRLALQDLPHAL